MSRWNATKVLTLILLMALGNNVAFAAGKSPKKLKGCLGLSAKDLNLRAAPYQEAIAANAKRYGVDQSLIKAVIAVESCFRIKARSHANAQGLMQLIPATAERFGVTNPYSIKQNIRGGTKYLSWLNKRFRGNLSKTLAGYNAGEGAVDKYKGIPPYRETQFYVKHVTMLYKRLGGKANTPSPIQTQPILAQPNDDGMTIIAGRLPKENINLPVANVQRALYQKQQPVRVQQAAYKPAAQHKQVGQLGRRSQPRRVAHVYRVAKPGRAGWQANKARAPQLYKR